MSLLNVKEALKGTELENSIIRLPHTGATVEMAADAVGCDPDQIAKTLSFLVGEKPILIVVSGNARIDNKKYKGYFHKKAKMISRDEVEALTGHQPGGVCPFGVKDGVEIYFDQSLKRHDVFYPAAGDENYVIRMPVETARSILKITDYIDATQDQE